ncbi:MAG: ferredoxin family protein [Coriobacteriia bacterium]|nr:ferredoxin family protein [Coriobacteriia bacterium]
MATSCAIYYFSATGNSLAVALELAEKLHAPDPISIPGSFILEDPFEAARTADQVGFVFPVHRACLPEMVRGFIEMMPKREDCYYFAVSTYTVFGCNEFWDIDQILGRHNCWLNYGAGIRAMGNVGLFDPGSATMARRLRQISLRIDEMVEAIANSQENTFRRSIKLLGRLVMAYTKKRRKSLFLKVNEQCKKCGICAQVCPAQNIIMTGDENGGPAPIRSDKCEACYACLRWCPANAIGTKTKLHSRYHHPNIKPEQLNPVQSTETQTAAQEEEDV